jgi:hypothetical protein
VRGWKFLQEFRFEELEYTRVDNHFIFSTNQCTTKAVDHIGVYMADKNMYVKRPNLFRQIHFVYSYPAEQLMNTK